jgi:hypothetical protein
VFFFVGAISGGLGVFWITTHRQRRVKRDLQLSSDPIYEEPLESVTSKMKAATSRTEAAELRIHVEMETNAAYGHVVTSYT